MAEFDYASKNQSNAEKTYRNIPKLPDIPKMRIVKFKPGVQVIKHAWISISTNIVKLLDARIRGEDWTIYINNKEPLSRQFGCKMCPYYGTNRCYHGLIPPKLHVNGLCSERANEILDYAEMSNSCSGKEIMRTEVLQKVANHINILESNLSDYRNKRLEELAASGNYANRNSKDMKFDQYEMMVMGQIQKLSLMLSGEMQADIEFAKKLHNGDGIKRITVQDLNIFIGDSAKALAKLEHDNPIDVESKVVDEYGPDDTSI